MNQGESLFLFLFIRISSRDLCIFLFPKEGKQVFPLLVIICNLATIPWCVCTNKRRSDDAHALWGIPRPTGDYESSSPPPLPPIRLPSAILALAKRVYTLLLVCTPLGRPPHTQSPGFTSSHKLWRRIMKLQPTGGTPKPPAIRRAKRKTAYPFPFNPPPPAPVFMHTDQGERGLTRAAGACCPFWR